MKALGISRVSTKTQAADDHFSLAYQHATITEHARAKDWELLDVIEYVKSGGSNQTELQQILRHAVRLGADVIMVMELDRLARDMVTTLLFLEDLAKHHIRFYSCADNLDLSSPEGELQMHVLAMFAAYFRKQLSRKVKSGQAQRAQAGKRHGERPFGYQPAGDSWAIDPVEAPIVQQVFAWYLDLNMGFRAIAKTLNSRKIAGQRGKTGAWDARTVERMLRREAYAGDTIYGKWNIQRDRTGSQHVQRQDPQIIRNTHPAIIARDRWNLVAQQLERRKGPQGRTHDSPYILSGLVQCGECGTSMVVTRGGGSRNPTYVCRAYHSKGLCSRATAMPVAMVEESILEALEQELMAAQRHPDAAMMQRWLADDPAVALQVQEQRIREHRLREIPRMLARAEDAMLQGAYSIAEFMSLKTRLTAEQTALQQPVTAPPFDESALVRRVEETLATFQAVWALPPEKRSSYRNVVQRVILSITFYPARQLQAIFSVTPET